jgi:gliding motility-associated-like protein
MNIYRLFKFRIFVVIVFLIVSATAKSQCFQIESILVDAFDSPSSPEGLNEMVRFRVGPTAVNTSNMNVTWPTTGNPWLGLIQNTITATKIATINANILATGGCGQLIEPVGGVLPANATVILVSSFNFDATLNNFAGLTQPTYIIFQNNPSTIVGNFGNYNNVPSNRTLTISFGACTDSVTYDVSLLVNSMGQPGTENGATVNFTPAGVPTYVNNGNSAPVITFKVDAGPATLNVCAGVTIPLNGTAQGQTAAGWSAASGTFSNPSNLTTNYTVSLTASGTVTLTLTVSNGCGGQKTDTILLNVAPLITPTFTQLAPICFGSNPPTLPTTSNNGITGTWFPPMSSTVGQTYFFTPTAGQCATSQSMSTTINNNCTFGGFATALFITNCLNSTFYNTSGSGQDLINPLGLGFNNTDLGTYIQNSNNLVLKGGEVKTFKNATTNVCGATLRYRVYLQSATPGAFNSIVLPFYDSCNTATNSFNSGGPCVATDQKWQNTLQNINLTNNLPGDYFLEVFYDINGDNNSTSQCDDTVLVNNNSANFRARFAIKQSPAILSFTSPTSCLSPNGTITVSNLTPSIVYALVYSRNGVATASTNYTANASGNIIISGLDVGTYNNFVLNFNGCSTNVSTVVTLTSPTNPANPQANVTNATCTNATGTIDVVSPTGLGFTYSIDGVNYQSSTQFLGLSPNSYQLTVKNSGDCVSNAVVFVINPPSAAPASPTVNKTDVSCTNSTGTINIISPSGAGFTYSIDGTNFLTTSSFSNLNPNTYNVYVKNAAGCQSLPTSVTINAAPPTPVLPMLTITQPSCVSSTGEISVSSPTTAGFTFSINGGSFQSSPTFSGLLAGNYTITYRNNVGCVSATATATLNSVAPLGIPTIDKIDVQCNAGGSITILTPTGTGYTYSINNGSFQVSPLFDNLLAGTYTVQFKDPSGCISASTSAIIAPSQPILAPTFNTNDAQCNIGGSISVLTPSGTGFLYSIDGVNYVPTVIFSNLSANVYSLTVKNSLGCVSPPAVVTVLNNSNTTPINLGDFVICLDKNGLVINSNFIYTGYSPVDFNFAWSFNGTPLTETTDFLEVLLAGNYQAIATDKISGCSQVFNATVTIIPFATATANVATDFAGQQQILVNVQGGSGNFVYQLNDNGFQPNNIFSVINGGSYTIFVEDTKGCNTIEIPVRVLDFPRFFTPNGDSYNDTWNVYGLPFPDQSSLFIFDRYGKLIKQLSVKSQGWDGKFNGQDVLADDYWFKLNYLDSNVQMQEYKSHFSLKR